MFDKKKTDDLRCSICGRHKNDTEVLVDTGQGILICDRCVNGARNRCGGRDEDRAGTGGTRT